MNNDKKFTLYILLLISIMVTINMTNSQHKFNIFKSYENAQVKPKQYSKKQLRHSIDEYLTSVQKQMLRKRSNKRNNIKDMFDDNWSGFDLEKNKGSDINV
jgi:hypothetical protein